MQECSCIFTGNLVTDDALEAEAEDEDDEVELCFGLLC